MYFSVWRALALSTMFCFSVQLGTRLLGLVNGHASVGNHPADEDSAFLRDGAKISADGYRNGTETNESTDENQLHFVVVCIGAATKRNFQVLLRSLLLNRNDQSIRVNFHVITNSEEIVTFRRSFSGWSAPNFALSFYSAQSLHSYVKWISTTHYSGLNGLLKLAVGEILPESVTQAVIIDTDMIFVGEVAEIKSIFNAMRQSDASIGLVIEQSSWYSNHPNSLWLTPLTSKRQQPIVKSGFNSGLVLIDFATLKGKPVIYENAGISKQYRSTYTSIAMDVAKRFLEKLKQTSTGDQDIINAMAVEHPHLFYTISSKWNYQSTCLKIHTRDNCHQTLSSAKILHWNVPTKLFKEAKAKTVVEHGDVNSFKLTEVMKVIQLHKLYSQLVGYIRIPKAKKDSSALSNSNSNSTLPQPKKLESSGLLQLLDLSVSLNVEQVAASETYQISDEIFCSTLIKSARSETLSLRQLRLLSSLNSEEIGKDNNSNRAFLATALINLPDSIEIACSFDSVAAQ